MMREYDSGGGSTRVIETSPSPVVVTPGAGNGGYGNGGFLEVIVCHCLYFR